MMQQHHNSEIARLMAQIAAEHEAAEQALKAPAYTAKHAFITARMERIGAYGEQLKALVGAEQSLELVCQAIEGKHT